LSMTLDEYRMQVFEKLRACTEASHAREILSEVRALLASSRMSDSGQKGFWQSLSHDLNVLAHQLTRPSDRAVVSARTVIATAQSAIAQYQRQLKSDG
jgi:hypothetical protein